MTPFARGIVQEAAALHGVAVEMLLSRCRVHKLFLARVEIAKTLHNEGYTSSKIGAVLNRDHTTILYYLGQGARRPKLLQRWHRPHVKHVCWIRTPKPPPKTTKPHRSRRRQYLVPYAGADERYVWIERPERTA